jgi:hypothetical protein
MNSNATAIKLAKQCEAAVSGAWIFTFEKGPVDEQGRDGMFILTTVQAEVVGARAKMAGKYEVLSYMLHHSDLEEDEV